MAMHGATSRANVKCQWAVNNRRRIVRQGCTNRIAYIITGKEDQLSYSSLESY